MLARPPVQGADAGYGAHAGDIEQSTRCPGSLGLRAIVGGDPDGDAGGSAHSVKGDMQHFMHALFQAMKGEASATSSTGNGSESTTSPQADFATGLSALISQVGNGSAPADLQSAFKTLVCDLQADGSGNGGSDASASGPGSVTLQQLLTQVQQDMGYGPASASTSTGNLVSTNV